MEGSDRKKEVVKMAITKLPFTCSNSTIETLEKWRRSDVFIVNFEQFSHLFLAFLLWTLNI